LSVMIGSNDLLPQGTRSTGRGIMEPWDQQLLTWIKNSIGPPAIT